MYIFRARARFPRTELATSAATVFGRTIIVYSRQLYASVLYEAIVSIEDLADLNSLGEQGVGCGRGFAFVYL